MKKLIFLIFTVVMVTTMVLSAGTLTGRIQNSSGQGIQGVSVKVKNVNNEEFGPVMTSDNGSFQITYTGGNPATLTCTLVGYFVDTFKWTGQSVTVTMVPVEYLANAYTRERSPILMRKEDNEILVA
jgi:hypothetical protein